MEELYWEKFNNEHIENIEKYVLNYIKTIDRNAKIIVGCDSSNNHSKKTVFAITVVFYNEQKRHGAHVVFAKIKTSKIKDVSVKIWKEAEYVFNIASLLDKTLRGEYYFNFDKNYYDNSTPTKLVEVHVDINPKRNTKNGRKLTNNKSNLVYPEIMGWLCSCGFKVVSKPYSFGATNSADAICSPS